MQSRSVSPLHAAARRSRKAIRTSGFLRPVFAAPICFYLCRPRSTHRAAQCATLQPLIQSPRHRNRKPLTLATRDSLALRQHHRLPDRIRSVHTSGSCCRQSERIASSPANIPIPTRMARANTLSLQRVRMVRDSSPVESTAATHTEYLAATADASKRQRVRARRSRGATTWRIEASCCVTWKVPAVHGPLADARAVETRPTPVARVLVQLGEHGEYYGALAGPRSLDRETLPPPPSAHAPDIRAR